jgi:hypothetical protein
VSKVGFIPRYVFPNVSFLLLVVVVVVVVAVVRVRGWSFIIYYRFLFKYRGCEQMETISLLRPVSRRPERTVTEERAGVTSNGTFLEVSEHSAFTQQARRSLPIAHEAPVVEEPVAEAVHVIVDDDDLPKAGCVSQTGLKAVHELPGRELLPVASADVVLKARQLMYRMVAKLLLDGALPMASKGVLAAALGGTVAKAGWTLLDLCVIGVQCGALFPDDVNVAPGIELIVSRYLSASTWTPPATKKRVAVVTKEVALPKRSKMATGSALNFDVEDDIEFNIDFALDLRAIV